MTLSDNPSARAAFGHRDFRFFLSARFLALVAHQMMIIAVSQAIYEITRNPLHLGYIGLAIFLPRFLFTLPAGHAADRFDRRKVILIARCVEWLSVVCLFLLSLIHFQPLWALFALLFIKGIAYAFDGPASQAIVTQVVPEELFSNAVSWNSTGMQMAFIVGPALGGWIYAVTGNACIPLFIVAVLRLLSVLLIIPLRPRTDHIERTEISLKTVLAGLSFVFEKKIILGAISLDLFAVLLGGAVALMPIFANEILHVGPRGLGILRATPSLGAALMAAYMAYHPPQKRAGLTMLTSVAIFGIATILFGLSRNFYFTLGCLFVLGAADMVSVVIRHVLVQIQTPAAMRGRVSAVNLIFIGASNELGEFESGVTARWFGTIPAVVLGGLGTLAVVALWSWKFPQIRKYQALEKPL